MPRTLSRGRTQETVPAPANSNADWGDIDSIAPKSKDFAEEFKPQEGKTYIIKFLEPKFLVAFRQHWIDEAKGKKSFICTKTLADPEADCPLCDIADQPRLHVVFNILDLTNPAKPVNKLWVVTAARLRKSIEALSKEPQSSPLDRDNLYWKVTRIGKGTDTNYPLNPIFERQLSEDPTEGGYGWDQANVLTPEQVQEYRDMAYDESDAVRYNTAEELQEVADKIS